MEFKWDHREGENDCAAGNRRPGEPAKNTTQKPLKEQSFEISIMERAQPLRQRLRMEATETARERLEPEVSGASRFRGIEVPLSPGRSEKN